MKKITIGISDAVSGVVLIAKELDYFRELDFEVDFRFANTGRKLLSFLQKGWVDAATIIDANIALMATQREKKIRVVACTQMKIDDSIIARADRGINEPRDLIGKKVSFLPNTSSHVFLYNFCQYHNIDFDDLKHVHLPPDAVLGKFISGEIDAVCSWEPHITRIRLDAGQAGVGLKYFVNDGIYKFYVALAVGKKALKNKSSEIESILAVLKKSEIFIKENPEEAQRIYSDITDIPLALVRDIWGKFDFTISPVNDDFINQVELIKSWMDKDCKVNIKDYIDNMV